jgi:hypothetical protein
VVSTNAEPDELSEAVVQEITEAAHLASLHELRINDFLSERYFGAAGNLARLLTRAPQLQHLAVGAATMALGPVEHAALRTLSLRGPNVPFAGVARSRWPALERLELRFTADEPVAVDRDDLERLLTSPPKVLRIAGVATPLDVVAGVAGAQRLFRLDLEPVDEAAAKALLQLPLDRAPEHLELVDVQCPDEIALELVDRFGERARVDHPALAARRRALRATTPAPPVPAGPAPLAAGDAVVHAKFGAGSIVYIEEGDKLAIRFADGAERKLLAKFVTRA